MACTWNVQTVSEALLPPTPGTAAQMQAIAVGLQNQNDNGSRICQFASVNIYVSIS
jgi:hypothetical protein